MSYCNVQDVINLLPEKITVGNINIGSPSVPVAGRGTANRSTFTPEQVENYIVQAGQYIDSRLRSVYLCPLRRIKTFETDILSNLIHGGNIIVQVHDSGPFSIGFMVRVQDGSNMEFANVKSISSINSIVLDKLSSDYVASDYGKISIVEYPDPVKIIAAQLAVSVIISKLFVGEQSPDVSKYGVDQRNLAILGINSINMGETILNGQDFFGKRFQRTQLTNAYKTPIEITRNDEKS